MSFEEWKYKYGANIQPSIDDVKQAWNAAIDEAIKVLESADGFWSGDNYVYSIPPENLLQALKEEK